MAGKDFNDDDALLVKRIRIGDERALEELLRKYYQPLVTFSLRYVASQDTGEEVVHDVFIRIWNRRIDWHLESTCRAYLYTAVRNAALKHVRSATRRSAAELAAAVENPSGKLSWQSDSNVEHAELYQAFRKAVSTLPERCREVFLLSHDHNLPYSEIATILGITQSTARNQMARALSALERHLAPWLAGLVFLRAL